MSCILHPAKSQLPAGGVWGTDVSVAWSWIWRSESSYHQISPAPVTLLSPSLLAAESWLDKGLWRTRARVRSVQQNTARSVQLSDSENHICPTEASASPPTPTMAGCLAYAPSSLLSIRGVTCCSSVFSCFQQPLACWEPYRSAPNLLSLAVQASCVSPPPRHPTKEQPCVLFSPKLT